MNHKAKQLSPHRDDSIVVRKIIQKTHSLNNMNVNEQSKALVDVYDAVSAQGLDAIRQSDLVVILVSQQDVFYRLLQNTCTSG
jgi:hypothetical protein